MPEPTTAAGTPSEPRSRPAVPSETIRLVKLEAGHRCAACGETNSLEIAHIRSWARSRNHSPENLICLCANCHTRADKEKWGEKGLRWYKEHPWVKEKGAGKPGVGPAAVRTTIKIVADLTLETYTPEQERWLRYALAQFLNIVPEEIRIETVKEGSVIITVSMPQTAVLELTNCFDEFRLGVPFGLLDLVGAGFERANLRAADLGGANLERANLRGANLKSAILVGTNLTGADLERANLRAADLKYADLTGADLENANLFRANLEGAILEGANFKGANFERANLEGAILEGADFKGANFERAKLRTADLEHASLKDINLDRAILADSASRDAHVDEISTNHAQRRLGTRVHLKPLVERKGPHRK